LLKKYHKLWVFGDSFSTPDYWVEPQKSFWGLVGLYLNCDSIENLSWAGNSFDSVTHMLVGMSSQYDWQKDFFIIGVPPLERFTVFDNHKDTLYQSQVYKIPDWKVTQEKIHCHHGLENKRIEQFKDLSLVEDRSWTETRMLTSIFLLTQWLDRKNANYLIVNLSKPFDLNNQWGPSEFVLPYCNQHSKCILFDNTYYSVNYGKNKPADFDKYGWMGHHGSAGNKCFFEESILPVLEKESMC
jgi:hypothetical protein